MLQSTFGRLGALTTLTALSIGALAACGGDDGQETPQVAAVKAAPPIAMATPADTGAKDVPDTTKTAVSEPEPVVVSYGDAERVFRSGEYGEAADMFEAYVGRRPDNPWGHYMLGISAWKAGDHERAEAALRRTLEVDSTHGKSLINLARVLLEQGNASDALEPAERVVELDSASGEGWRVLGNARSDLGLVVEAVEAYRTALELDHRDAWTMNNLGLLMIREGRYEEALPPLARATELRPDQALFQNNLGVALERSGHPVEAADAFRAALLARPDYEKAKVSLERVQARVVGPDVVPVDVAGLAAEFASEIEGWKEEVEILDPTVEEHGC